MKTAPLKQRIPLLGRRFQVDFVQARPAVAPVARLLLAAGVLALAGAVADLAPRWVQRQQLNRQKEQLQSRLERQLGVARPAARAEVIGLAQARGVLDELDRPWPALFDQLEATRVPGVHLVQLGVDSRFQTAQVLAEASNLEELLQYSQRLAGSGPVQSVRLTHHEWHDAPVGRIVVANLTAELESTASADKGAR